MNAHAPEFEGGLASIEVLVLDLALGISVQGIGDLSVKVLDVEVGSSRACLLIWRKGDAEREFAALAFKEAGLELEWQGAGLEEKGVEARTGRILVEVDPRYFRPTEVIFFCFGR